MNVSKPMFAAILAFSFLTSASAAEAPWLTNIKWCQQNATGSEPHDAAIAGLAPNCFAGGKHPNCLYSTAADAAKHGQDDRAMNVLVECQGHNGGAQDSFRNNRSEVLLYLRQH